MTLKELKTIVANINATNIRVGGFCDEYSNLHDELQIKVDEQYQEVAGRYKSKEADDMILPDERETSEDERIGDDRTGRGRSGEKTLRSHIRKSV